MEDGRKILCVIKSDQEKTSQTLECKLKVGADGTLTMRVDGALKHGYWLEITVPPTELKCEFCHMPGLKACNGIFDGENLCNGKVHCKSCSIDSGEPGSRCFYKSK